MVTLAGRLLEAAELLLKAQSRSSAFKRRAVSTAYYAVFHAVDKVCADYVTNGAKRSSEEYNRVYRALDHKQMKDAFAKSPMKDNEKLRGIGSAVISLQNERHRADYLPPIQNIFTDVRAAELVSMARETVRQIESIQPEQAEYQMLALNILFKERQL